MILTLDFTNLTQEQIQKIKNAYLAIYPKPKDFLQNDKSWIESCLRRAFLQECKNRIKEEKKQAIENENEDIV